MKTLTLLKLTFLFLIIDFSGDYLLVWYSDLVVSLAGYIRILIISLLMFAFFSLFLKPLNFKISKLGISILSMITMTYIYALLIGLLGEYPMNALRESMAIAPIILIPLLMSLDEEERNEFFHFAIYTLIIVILLKIIFGIILHYALFGGYTWKIFNRSSPLLLIPLFYFFHKILNYKPEFKSLAGFSISLFGILVAQARTLNFVVLLGLILIFFFPGKGEKVNLSSFFGKRILMSAFLFFSVLLAALSTGTFDSSILGNWSGENFNTSAGMRIDQLNLLVSRMEENILGVGFGYVTKGFSDYEELNLSYLLELDLINFISKTGIFMGFIYLFSYIIFIYVCVVRLKQSKNDQSILIAYSLSIPLLLAYSVMQALHSSILFWVAYSLAFSYIFFESKNKKIINLNSTN